MINDFMKKCFILQCNHSEDNSTDGKKETFTIKANNKDISITLFFCKDHSALCTKLKKIIDIINEECIFEYDESTYECKSIQLNEMFSFRKRLISENLSDLMYKILLSSYDGKIDKTVVFDDANKNENFEIFKNTLVATYKKLEEVLV